MAARAARQIPQEDAPPPGMERITRISREDRPTGGDTLAGDTREDYEHTPWLVEFFLDGIWQGVGQLDARPFEPDLRAYYAAAPGSGQYKVTPISRDGRRPLRHLSETMAMLVIPASRGMPVPAPMVEYAQPPTPTTAADLEIRRLELQVRMREIESQEAQARADATLAAERERLAQERQDRFEAAQVAAAEAKERREREAEDRREDRRAAAAMQTAMMEMMMRPPAAAPQRDPNDPMQALVMQLANDARREKPIDPLDAIMAQRMKLKLMREIEEEFSDKPDRDDDDEKSDMQQLAEAAGAAAPLLAAMRGQAPATTASAATGSPDGKTLAAWVAQPALLQQAVYADPNGVLGSLSALAKENPELARSLIDHLQGQLPPPADGEGGRTRRRAP